jgi:hypothetical protein
VIALALNAAPVTSPLDLLAAAEIPAMGPKTAGGSHFHSMLKAVTDTDDRPKTKPAKKDVSPDNAAVTAVPVAAQRVATPPITFNLFPANDTANKKDGDDPEAASTDDEKTAPRRITGVAVQPRLSADERGATNQQARGETQPDPDRPLAVDASVADGSLSKITPAFEMHLQATEPQESTAAAVAPSSTAADAGKSADARPTKDNMADSAEAPAAAATEAAPGVNQSAASNSKHGDGSHHPGQEKPQDPASTGPQPDASADLSQARFDVNAPVAPAGSTISSTHAAASSETKAPAETAVEPSTPAPAAAAPVAHDIKLELNVGGGQRVEVRLTDRAGDIHVAVRTPDARLSDTMRADLPALAAKLEQSGFHTDAWQPGGGGERRALETGAGNASQDSQEHGGQNQQQKQDDPQQQQQQKNLTNATNRKTDRKDFAWLLQTYR